MDYTGSMNPEDTRALIKEMKISFPTRDDFRKLEDDIASVKADTKQLLHISKLDEELIPIYDRLKVLEERTGIGGDEAAVLASPWREIEERSKWRRAEVPLAALGRYNR